jgi:hypothetical protein
MRIAEAVSRGRVAVSGAVTSVGSRVIGGGESFTCVLNDGTGELELLFLGRCRVPGIGVGARCKVEGTARMESSRLVVWNPLYRLETPSTANHPLDAE